MFYGAITCGMLACMRKLTHNSSSKDFSGARDPEVKIIRFFF